MSCMRYPRLALLKRLQKLERHFAVILQEFPAQATPASPSKLTRVPTWLLDGDEDEADRELADIALRALQCADHI